MEGSMMNLEKSRRNDDDLLPTIAIVIIDLLVVNKNYGGKDNYFHQTAAMPRSSEILAFLSKIKKYAKCSEACFVVGLIYVDRIVNTHDFVLTPHNVYLTYLTAVMLAAKFHEDIFYNNAFFAQLGERTLKEINAAEIELISLLQFSMVVRGNLYDKYHQELCEYRARTSALANQQQQQQQQQHQQQAMMSMGLYVPPAPLVPIIIPHALPVEALDTPPLAVYTPQAQQVIYDFAPQITGIPFPFGHGHGHQLVYPVSPGAGSDAGMLISTLPAPPGLDQQHQHQHQHVTAHPVVYQTMVPAMPMPVATVTPMLVGGYGAPVSPTASKTVFPVHHVQIPSPTPSPLHAMEGRQPYY